MDVVLEGSFLLSTQVSTSGPEEELTLGLGVDQGVKVSRNSHFREETTGLMGGALLLTHKVVVEVANQNPYAALSRPDTSGCPSPQYLARPSANHSFYVVFQIVS